MPATYTDATVQRCATIIANADREQIARILAASKSPTMPKQRATTTRKPKTQAPAKPDWRERIPSDSQMSRINSLERALGYRLSTKTTIGTAGNASDLYQSLKAEYRSL